MNKTKIIITTILLGLLGTGSFYLGGFQSLGSMIISLCVYTIIFYLLKYFWKKIRKQEVPDSRIFIQNFWFGISIFLSFIVVCIAGISYQANEVSPSKLDQYTISNGEKTVIFQSMMHIGREGFYKEIQQELTQAKKNGYVYFYEGVRPGKKENHKKFNEALGLQFDANLYKNISKMYGMTYQTPQMFLGLVNNLDFNIDTNIDEIMNEYEKITKGKTIEKQESFDANKEIETVLNTLTPRELEVFQYINKALLNTLFSNEEIFKNLQIQGNKYLFDVILDKRNEHLVQEIIKSEHKKIFVTYGALHFDGVLKMLQKNDKNWKIINTKPFYPVTKKILLQ
ncbi:TraB/GumN family protein [Candidatus Gracilibacteria bacterium]|nr:TraB/GumN family protein [Candidatus Gracilibacteria bacterium]